MMRTRDCALFNSILLFLLACQADSISVPSIKTSAVGLKPSFIVYSDCPTGETCVDPEHVGPVDAVASLLIRSCSGDFGCLDEGKISGSVTVDAASRNRDQLTINCSSGNIYVTSDYSCWDCTDGCGGTADPTGLAWKTVTVMDPGAPGELDGQIGSDCHAFRCPVGYAYHF
jgi:hypothetical protein